MGTENFDHELNDLCRALKLPSVARDALIQAHSDFVRLFLGDFMSDVRRARIV